MIEAIVRVNGVQTRVPLKELKEYAKRLESDTGERKIFKRDGTYETIRLEDEMPEDPLEDDESV